MKTLEEYINQQKKLVNFTLKQYLNKYREHSVIGKAINYSVFAGGKRFRPILMLSIGEMLGVKPSVILPSACAVEMIHTFSLIHDDLPAMDNDDFRRGMPTAHKKFGEAIAILAGDALLALAFEVITAHRTALIRDKQLLNVISVLSRAIGIEGVIMGQELDLKHENHSVSFRKMQEIHQLKTGKLLEACAEIAARLSTKNEVFIRRIKKYARHVGLAFQITDDILDVTGNLEKLGKTPGSDARKKKSTYVGLFGIEGAIKAAKIERDRAVKELKVFGNKAGYLIKLADFVLERQR